jgi:hypothetical protein
VGAATVARGDGGGVGHELALGMLEGCIGRGTVRVAIGSRTL